jgi:hypothetical protein
LVASWGQQLMLGLRVALNKPRLLLNQIRTLL